MTDNAVLTSDEVAKGLERASAAAIGYQQIFNTLCALQGSAEVHPSIASIIRNGINDCPNPQVQCIVSVRQMSEAVGFLAVYTQALALAVARFAEGAGDRECKKECKIEEHTFR